MTGFFLPCSYRQRAASAIVLLAWGHLIVMPAARADQPPEAGDPSATVATVVTGQVRYAGQIPLAATPDGVGTRHPLLTVDRRSGGVQGMVVWLSSDVDPPADDLATVDKLPAVLIDQVNEMFVPQVVAVRAGQKVDFRNSDGANHNVRAASTIAANQFNIYTAAGEKYTHRFVAHPKQRPVLVGCDIHPWMRAWIYVFDHPRFAVTNTVGQFRIANVPPGDYLLHVRHPATGLNREQTIHVAAGQPVAIELKFDDSDLPEVNPR